VGREQNRTRAHYLSPKTTNANLKSPDRGTAEATPFTGSGRPVSREYNRISAISQLPEMLATQRDLDELAGDPYVPEVQRGIPATSSPTGRARCLWIAEAGDALACLARVPDDLHRLHPSLVAHDACVWLHPPRRALEPQPPQRASERRSLG
jgi:hypothetical protein